MKKTMLLFGFCASVMTACGTLGLGGPTATATVDAEATAAVEAEQALSTQNAQATVDAITATAEAEETSAFLTEAAATPTLRSIYATGTFEANQSLDIVQSLHDGGFISTTEGSDLSVFPYHESIAKINYFTWQNISHSPTDFVFRSNIEWQSASDVSNWFDAGCGIVFRHARNSGNFYIVFLRLDGNVELFTRNNLVWNRLSRVFYDNLDIPNGGAELIVTAEGEHIQVFINSKLVIDVMNAQFPDGRLGFTISSGTNKGFGTRCNFDDVTLWELDSTD